MFRLYLSVCISVHAAVIAINEAIDHQIVADTLTALNIPQAHLRHVLPELADDYQNLLYEAKISKAEIARNKVFINQ